MEIVLTTIKQLRKQYFIQEPLIFFYHAQLIKPFKFIKEVTKYVTFKSMRIQVIKKKLFMKSKNLNYNL